MDGSEAEAAPRVGRRRVVADGRLPLWFGIPFLAFGIAALAIGVLVLQSEQRFGAEGVAVTGTVSRLWTTTDDEDNSTDYHVGYLFTDPNTQGQHGGSGTVGWSTYFALRLGDPITVTYLPSEPATHRLGTPEPQLLMPLAMLGFGALFALTGPILLVTAVRQRRDPSSGAPPRPAIPGPPVEASESERRRVDVFSRSPMRLIGELVVAPLLGVGLLAFAWWALGNLDLDSDLAGFALVAVIFAVIMFGGFARGLRRGLNLTLLEVGPDGIWLPETGRLPWSAIAEVRLEESLGTRRRGAARRIVVAEDGTEQESSSPGTFPRVGIVPRDRALLDRAPDGISRGLTEAVVGLASAMRPEIGLTMSDPSPFGVTSYDIRQPIAAVVESVRRFTRVVDARPAHAAPAASPMVAAPAVAGAFEPASVLSDQELRAIDARLGQPTVQLAQATASLNSAIGLDASAAAPLVDPARTVPQASAPRVFRRDGSASGTLSILIAGRDVRLPPIGQMAVPVMVGAMFVTLPTLMALGAIASALSGGTDGSTAIIGVAVAAVFTGVGLVTLRGASRTAHAARETPDLLEVGPDGLRTRDDGLLPWSSIESVTSRDGTLEIQPMPGAGKPLSLELGLFHVDPDEIIDAIARYRIVDEE